MKISVITPCYNSGDTIEQAVKSVVVQGYGNCEHVIVDGASTDNTLEILKKYSHLKWISEPDSGQVEAMSKGFRMATGDIIVYLNADDYFLEGAFSAVIPHFQAGEKVVMGKVLVRTQRADGVQEWINDPKTDLEFMLRHWEPDAFCVNAVGYFYRREVQEQIPFNKQNDDKHDLEFLLEVALRYKIKKIDAVLGCFTHSLATKTALEQMIPSYWCNDNFPFVDRVLKHVHEDFQKKFHLDRERGYQLRRHWTVQDAFKLGMAKELIDKGEVFFLPEDEGDTGPAKGSFVEHDRIATKGDWIILVLTMGKVASKAIHAVLKSLPTDVLPAQVYHIHQINEKTLFLNLPGLAHVSVGLSLNNLFNKHKNKLHWKFIIGMREPLDCSISSVFEIEGSELDIHNTAEKIYNYIFPYKSNWFDVHVKDGLGIDIYDYEFNKKRGYTIIKKGNIEILLYRMESLPQIFSRAMKDFLGISDLKLTRVNVTSSKPYGKVYKQVIKKIQFKKEFMDDVYSSKLVNNFYTEKEIAEFYKRWSKGKEKNARSAAEYEGIIYDVGLHEGQDTEFYLKKGFKVVAVDANPVMVEAAEKKFASFVKSGQLILLNVGIVDEVTEDKLTFYVNEDISEWSSFIKELATRNNCRYHTVEVPCTTLDSIIRKYGFPYYVKTDIERHDETALRSLQNSDIRPRYVSVENGYNGMLEMLIDMGYDLFKYVQQNNMPSVKLPYPAREGKYVQHVFPNGASGPFGDEAPGNWICMEEVKKEISKVWNLETGEKNPLHKDEIDGWFDLHARLAKSSTNCGQEFEQLRDKKENKRLKNEFKYNQPTKKKNSDRCNINEDNFSKFTYSKISDFNLLNENYSEMLFGRCVDIKDCDLKAYQDLLVFAFIENNISIGSKILEVGGGTSRILSYFQKSYECWNVDKFEGIGNGPFEVPNVDYKIVIDYIGSFNEEIPDNYFDLVFSISVLEHVDLNNSKVWDNILSDIDRIIKPGGYSLHCIDMTMKGKKSWTNGILYHIFKEKETINQFIPLANADIDPDLFVLSKEYYNKTWIHTTKKTYEEFGRPASYNILWKKN